MIIRARAVITMDGDPIADGAVALDGNRIVDVGPWPEVHARNSGEVIDLGESVLLPGLINAHCHLDYTDLRGVIPRASSFTAWIRAINAQKAAWNESDYVRSIENGLDEAARFGTTTIVNLETAPRLIPQIKSSPVRTWWFAEMIDAREAVSAEAIYENLAETMRGREVRGGFGLAPHAPFTASRNLYLEASAVAAREGLPLTTHLAESREEFEMFRHARGPLFEFLRDLGRRMDDCGEVTPLALLLNADALDERWIVAHLNELTSDDFRLLEGAPKFSIAHCPRSHAYFEHAPFPFKELRARGFRISLGTDSLASAPDLNLFAEMHELRKRQPDISARELLEMVTINPAAALRQGDQLGRLRAGFFADLIALPFCGRIENVYDETVNSNERLIWLMIDGETVFRA